MKGISMIGFNLDEYKGYKKYMYVFDVLIKKETSNKELFLESLYISPSSYRRVKNDGNKVGEQICEDLCKYFKYTMCEDLLIDQIEEYINKIYYDIYYKKYQNYEEHIKWIDEMLDRKYLVFPIFLLFKIILILNNPKKQNNIVDEYQELYKEIKSFEDFYTEELKELVEITDVTFKKDIDNAFLAQNYRNVLTYHTLANRCLKMNRHIESLYFCNIAKRKFIEDENYKRVYYINLIILANYNSLLKFDDAYLLSNKQIIALESINNQDEEYLLTKKHLILSCLGLKKYDEVILYLNEFKKLTLSDISCLLISYYYTDNKEYQKLLDNLINNSNVEVKEYVQVLNKYLHQRNKKNIYELEKYNINKIILDILRTIIY